MNMKGPIEWLYESSTRKRFPIQSLEMMVDIGCDVNATNLAGDTALHVVAMKRRLDSLIWLLIEGADVNAKGSGGDTPLHVAVRCALPPKPQDAWMLFKQKVE